jgi:hypothetical protein
MKYKDIYLAQHTAYHMFLPHMSICDENTLRMVIMNNIY